MITRLKEIRNSLSDKDRAVADYLIGHAPEVLNLSIGTLGERAGVSAATVSRFAKTLFGMTFPQLKVALAQDVAGGGGKQEDYALSIQSGMDQIQHRLAANLQQLFFKTCILNPASMFSEIAARIAKAKHVYLFGIGASGLAVQDLAQKLVKLGKRTSFNMDSNLAILNSSLCTDEDFVIAISYSGLSKEVLLPARKAKSCGCPVLAITSTEKNPLRRIADYELVVPLAESKIVRITAIYSRYGQFFLVDQLFLAVMKELGAEPEEFYDRYNDLLLELKK